MKTIDLGILGKLELYDCKSNDDFKDQRIERLHKVNVKEALRKATELFPGFNLYAKLHHTIYLEEKVITNKRLDEFTKRIAIQYWRALVLIMNQKPN